MYLTVTHVNNFHGIARKPSMLGHSMGTLYVCTNFCTKCRSIGVLGAAPLENFGILQPPWYVLGYTVVQYKSLTANLHMVSV